VLFATLHILDFFLDLHYNYPPGVYYLPKESNKALAIANACGSIFTGLLKLRSLAAEYYIWKIPYQFLEEAPFVSGVDYCSLARGCSMRKIS
jgi:hypothetical protein